MCSLDKDLLYSYIDGTIGELEKIFVEEHLKYCTECQKELRKIREFDNELENLNYKDIYIPDRLSMIAEMVAENCMSQMEKEQVDIEYANYKEGMKLIRVVAKEGIRYIYDNPYSKRTEEKLNKCGKVVKKQAKKFWHKKLSKTKIANNKLIKILKVV